MGGGTWPAMEVLKDWMYEELEYNNNGRAIIVPFQTMDEVQMAAFEGSGFEDLGDDEFGLDYGVGGIGGEGQCLGDMQPVVSFGVPQPQHMPVLEGGYGQVGYVSMQESGMYAL